MSGNTATAGNTAGDATAFGGGIVVDGVLVLSGSTIRNNHVRVTVPAGSTAGAFGDSAGIGMGGYATITDSRLIGNSVSVKAPGGTASAMFAGTQRRERNLRNHDHAQRHQPQPTRCIDHLGIGHPPGRRHRSPEWRAARAP